MTDHQLHWYYDVCNIVQGVEKSYVATVDAAKMAENIYILVH